MTKTGRSGYLHEKCNFHASAKKINQKLQSHCGDSLTPVTINFVCNTCAFRTVKSLLSVCTGGLQVSTSHLCILNIGPGLPSKLYYITIFMLVDPPLKIFTEHRENFHFQQWMWKQEGKHIFYCWGRENTNTISVVLISGFVQSRKHLMFESPTEN